MVFSYLMASTVSQSVRVWWILLIPPWPVLLLHIVSIAHIRILAAALILRMALARNACEVTLPSSGRGRGLWASDNTDFTGQLLAVLHTPGPLWEQATACLWRNQHHHLVPTTYYHLAPSP